MKLISIYNTFILKVTCLFSGEVEVSPSSRIGMISGNTRSPSFLTKSPKVLAATLWKKICSDNFITDVE